MKLNRVLKSLSALCLFFAIHANAESLSARETAEALKGTSWTGDFGAVGLGGKIAVRFSPQLTPDFNLQYKHELLGGGVLGEGLGPFDKACPFTPRTLAIQPTAKPDVLAGKIRVFKCAKSQRRDNANLLKNNRGKPAATIPVEQVEYVPEKNTLTIIANIKGISVTYVLTKDSSSDPSTAAPSSAPTGSARPAAKGHRAIR